MDPYVVMLAAVVVTLRKAHGHCMAMVSCSKRDGAINIAARATGAYAST